MTTQERLIYQIGTEVDQYINLVQEDAITDPNVRKFILEYVVPRFNRMRAIIGTYTNKEEDIQLPVFNNTHEVNDELPFNTK